MEPGNNKRDDKEGGEKKPQPGEPFGKALERLLATALDQPEKAKELAKGLMEAISEPFLENKELRRQHERFLALIVGVLLGLIIASGAFLAYTRTLDTTAFGFLIGPIIGGLVTYLISSAGAEEDGGLFSFGGEG